jgi:hypothetical protein
MDYTENTASNSSIVECIRCHSNVFTEPLSSKVQGDIHRAESYEYFINLFYFCFQNKEIKAKNWRREILSFLILRSLKPEFV